MAVEDSRVNVIDEVTGVYETGDKIPRRSIGRLYGREFLLKELTDRLFYGSESSDGVKEQSKKDNGHTLTEYKRRRRSNR